MPNNFKHLDLPLILEGKYRPPRGGNDGKLATTIENEANRESHSEKLRSTLSAYRQEIKRIRQERKSKGLPELPESASLLLKVDPKAFYPDKVRSFGLELVAEQADGLILGASSDLDFNKLQQRLNSFQHMEEGKFKNTAAQIWELETNLEVRTRENILSEELAEMWSEIKDSETYIVDVSISCYYKKMPACDPKKTDESDSEYYARYEKWKASELKWLKERDEQSFERQTSFQTFVQAYSGEFLSSFIEAGDSFSCRVSISGQCLKDIVENYTYIFDVSLPDQLDSAGVTPNATQALQGSITIVPPSDQDPSICVIDSGMQENHAYLSPAIVNSQSKSYVPGNPSTADYVGDGGHGTRVASAILYYPGIPEVGTYKLPFWLYNARVLDDKCVLNDKLYPPELMKKVVADFNQHGIKIYNHSIASYSPYRLKHMSAWAFEIDKLMWENDIIFVIPTGNIYNATCGNYIGIKDYLQRGIDYPDYLLETGARISNPSQSCFSLTVGSICCGEFENIDLRSIGKTNFPSSFTKSGHGIWGMIKPDVVEYGGDWVIDRATQSRFTKHSDTSSLLARSTRTGGYAVAKDGIGSSFAAPRVTHILGSIQKILPQNSALLYRALIAQSARWPKERPPTLNDIQTLRIYGYGVPSLENAISNSEFRVTLLQEKRIKARQTHLYKISIPEELRGIGDEYDILIEVTLSFKAQPRRTRMYTQSYLSTWLDWTTNKLGETFEDFRGRVMDNDDEASGESSTDHSSIPWTIQKSSNSGIRTFKLTNNTLQKDWATVESNKLGEEFSVAITAHQGWDTDPESEVPYAICVSFEAVNKDVEIYESIRVENEIRIEEEVRV